MQLTHNSCILVGQGELEGSKLYNELESNALQYFSQHMLKADPSRDSSMDMLSAGTLVVKLLPTVNADLDFFKERQDRLVPPDGEASLADETFIIVPSDSEASLTDETFIISPSSSWRGTSLKPGSDGYSTQNYPLSFHARHPTPPVATR